MDEATLRLEFPQAIKFMRDKIPLPSTSWLQYSGEVNQIAFTVAGITKASLLSDLQALVIRQLEQGVDVDAFRKSFDDLLTKSGWNLSGGKAYRAELVIQQNVRTSYSRGRFEQMRSPSVAKARPYWQWQWRDSRVPREHHKALDLSVFPANSEVFNAIMPPPWGCKCSVHALSERDLEREGLKVGKPPSLDTIREPGFGYGFSDLPKERDRLLAEAKRRLPPEFADLLDGEIALAEAIEAALNGTLDFAAPMFGKGSRSGGKKPNCTAGKSHFCQSANGRGSCVPLSKKCKFKPSGAEKAAADWVGEKIRTNENALDSRRRILSIFMSEIEDLDFDAVKEIETRFQKFADDANIYLRVTNEKTLQKIIEGGSLKNIWELPSKGKTEYLDKRKRVETEYMNIPSDAEPKDRPIYGYFAREGNTGLNEGNYTHGYGNVALKLKKDIKERSTISGDDTFHEVPPSSAKKVNAASLINTETFDAISNMLVDGEDIPYEASRLAEKLGFYEKPDRTSAWAPGIREKMNSNYFEAQIYGGVKTSDVEEIVYTYTGSKKPMPSLSTIEWAKENNVTIRFEKGKKRG